MKAKTVGVVFFVGLALLIGRCSERSDTRDKLLVLCADDRRCREVVVVSFDDCWSLHSRAAGFLPPEKADLARCLNQRSGVEQFRAVNFWDRVKGSQTPHSVPLSAPAAVSAKPATGVGDAAHAPGAPTPPPASLWEAESADEHARVAEREHDGVCTVSCTVDGSRRWSFDRPCEFEPADLHFVAGDCKRWVVFYAHPSPSSVSSGRYISVFDGPRLGWHVVGAALTRDLQVATSQPHLIASFGGTSGQPPHYAAQGAKVEFTTVEGLQQAVPLVAEETPAATKGKPGGR